MADIEIKRGYEVLPDNNVRFGIRVINDSDSAILDAEIILDYSESLFDLEGSKVRKLGTIPPAVPRTAKFTLKPRGCIHKEEIAATIRYKDHQWKRHTLEMHPKEVHCVCPFLKEKAITREDFLSFLDSGYLEERGVNFEGIAVDKVVDFLYHTCKNRLYRVDEVPTENGTILYLAGDALGEKAYYLLTAIVKEYDSVTQVLLRANSDKIHGLNGFLNEIMDNLRHLVLSAEAREIGIIKKEQVINIIDSVVQRTTFAGGEGTASVNVKGSVVQRTEIREDAEEERGERERIHREEEEKKERERKAREERDKKAREEAERKKGEQEKTREEERRKKQREEEERMRRERVERAAGDGGISQKKIMAVVLALGVLLVGYWAFAPGSPAPTSAADFTNSIGMEFVLIPAGEFEMGSPSDEMDRQDDEGPVHHVKIKNAFYMGRYEVTQREWKAVMGNDPSYSKGDDLPVEQVSWDDVQEFIKKLNEKEGTDKYRLPSEAEWEYACRAGTTTRYSFGDSESKLGDYAWYLENSGSKPHPVGKKKPNPYGLYDMHGEVCEWVQDEWHGNYNGAPADGSAWESGGGALRVYRGGFWVNAARNCRSAYRWRDVPGYRDDNLGFRLLKETYAPNSTNAPESSETVALPTRTATPDVPPDSGVTQTVSQTPTSSADQEGTIINSIGMEFVLIPAGEFDMGSPSDEVDRQDDEGPVHHVKIKNAFYMGRYEVTQKQWREIMGDNPSYFKGDDLPVEKVSWNNVQEFIRKLNEKEGTDYRLPSEAEWEYACRAGTTTRYSFGDSESKLGDYAWYVENSGSRPPKKGDYFRYDMVDWFSLEWNGKTHPIGKKKANPYGLYDMCGNVMEWVQDAWHDDYDGAPTDGNAWESGVYADRVHRGGSWNFFAGDCRSADRGSLAPGNRPFDIGFRLLEET